MGITPGPNEAPSRHSAHEQGGVLSVLYRVAAVGSFAINTAQNTGSKAVSFITEIGRQYVDDEYSQTKNDKQ